MLPDERDKLLAFFESDGRWCQNAEARDTHGSPVEFHDPLATAWDITGAMCCLFGWKRACTLFGQLDRHIHKRKRLHGFNQDAAIESMVILQAYNDRPVTTFEVILTLFETMPVWNDVSRASNASALREGSRQSRAPDEQNFDAGRRWIIREPRAARFNPAWQRWSVRSSLRIASGGSCRARIALRQRRYRLR